MKTSELKRSYARGNVVAEVTIITILFLLLSSPWEIRNMFF